MSIEEKIAELMAESRKLKKAEQEAKETAQQAQDAGQGETCTNEETKTVAETTIDVSEDVAALVNGEELTEEFKTKAATIFEAAVVTRVKAEAQKLQEGYDNEIAHIKEQFEQSTKELQEEFDAKLNEEVESIKEGLVDKVDGYLNYVVEQWMTQNELALESGMKNEIFESFIQGMKGLFSEHYIEVPEERLNVMGELEEHVAKIESKLDEQVAVNVKLNKQITEMKRGQAISEASVGLVATDAEKFKSLAEELSYDSAENFKKKLQTIKENYFSKTQKQTSPVQVATMSSPVLAESATQPVETQDEQQTVTEQINPTMARYLRSLQAIS